MKILGKSVSRKLQSFYNDIAERIGVPIQFERDPWALRYCYLSMTQSHRRWGRLREIFLKRAPDIAKKGEELINIIHKHGWENPDQALKSLIAIRGSLSLTRAQVIVVDRRTGESY